MKHRQNGAGLPVAIFIITVLALLVVGMAQLQQSSGEAVSLQIQSQRAFFAAESGVQVRLDGIFTTLDAGNAPSCPSDITTFNASGLSECSATFDCSADPANGRFTLASTGSCGSGAERASRTVEVRVQ
jgi:MSHA biogenesis protein MshP